VTTTGPYAARYFLRLSKNGDPDAATTYGLGNGGPTEDQRRVVDAGFLELTRLGVLAPDDPDVTASLPVVDKVIGHPTRTGPAWYRYGSGTAGTEDGYGFAATPQPYAFGVCGPDASGPVCAADPAGVPRAMDVITPSGVSQSGELDPTKGPVNVRSVPIP
jgi:glucoamylase